MSWVVYILDLAGLLLWLSFRRVGADPTRPAGTLLGNLRPAAPVPHRSWTSLGALLLMLVLRPLLLVLLATLLDATPTWTPGPTVIAFRADDWLRLYFFSTLSFVWTALVGYGVLLIFCALSRDVPELSSFSAFAVAMAGPVGRFPVLLILLLPAVAGALVWLGVGHLLEWQHLVPPTRAGWPLAVQSMIMGVAVWLPIRWIVMCVLLLRFVHNYVYLGEHSVWTLVQTIGRRLQYPLSWIPARLGRMDLVPLLACGLYWFLGELANRGLAWAFPQTLQ